MNSQSLALVFYLLVALAYWATLTDGQDLSKIPVIGMFGALLKQGINGSGADLVPNLLRQRGIITDLNALGCQVVDHGNVHIQESPKDKLQDCGGVEKAHTIADATKQIKAQTKLILDLGQIPLVMGGDPTSMLGVIIAQLEGGIVNLINLDARVNVVPVNQSKKGMDMSQSLIPFLLDELRLDVNIDQPQCPAMSKLSNLASLLNVKSTAWLGTRLLTRPELNTLKKLIAVGRDPLIKTFGTIRNLTNYNGLINALLQQLTKTATGMTPFLLNLNLDVLNPHIAPAAEASGAKVSKKEGMEMHQLLDIAGLLVEGGLFNGLSLNGINPLLGATAKQLQTTLTSALKAVRGIFGKVCKRLGKGQLG